MLFSEKTILAELYILNLKPGNKLSNYQEIILSEPGYRKQSG
jgi:hypothetical protein